MSGADWTRECAISITVCDRDGTIIDMNDEAALVFAKDGGKALIGQSVLACHPGAAQDKIEQMLETREPNFYTIEKNGRKKMICQVPWSLDGEPAGLVELAFAIPLTLPHFVRASDPAPADAT